MGLWLLPAELMVHVCELAKVKSGIVYKRKRQNFGIQDQRG
jgi:hypothetical protein